MRKVRIIANVSLDGVTQAPGGPDEDRDGGFEHGGWAMPFYDQAMSAAIAAAQGQRFDLLMARRTYDVFAAFWPTVTNDPIADGLNAATKYVATHRPDSLEWGPVEHLGGDIVAGVRRVKSQNGPDLIAWGGSTLTPVLLEHGLADEIVQLVYPVWLGSGKRFFPGSSQPRELSLVETKPTNSGVLINTYRMVGPLRGAEAIN